MEFLDTSAGTKVVELVKAVIFNIKYIGFGAFLGKLKFWGQFSSIFFGVLKTNFFKIKKSKLYIVIVDHFPCITFCNIH